jgi:hypothetical protein
MGHPRYLIMYDSLVKGVGPNDLVSARKYGEFTRIEWLQELKVLR